MLNWGKESIGGTIVEADFHVGSWFVQPTAGTVTKGRKKISLEPKVMDVLVYLVNHQGQVLPKDRIISDVWEHTFVGDGVLIHAISELRKAFEDDPYDPSFIETIPKRGYRLIAPVDEAALPVKQSAVGQRSQRVFAFIATLTVLALVGIVCWQFFKPRAPTVLPGGITSLAVLPLADLSGYGEHEYFAAGMTDSLISELGKISSLRVISRQSVLRFKDTELSLPQIADELNVDAIVEGTVLREGMRVRISVQLMEAFPERHLWSESFEGDLTDILSLQGALAQDLAAEINAAVTPDELKRLASSRVVNPESYEAFLKGRYHWDRWTVEDIKKSATWFKEAIAIDPSFAPAWAGLTFTYRFPSILGQIQGREVLPPAKEAALIAVELDSSWAEGQATLGVNDCYEWNWANCEDRILEALELNPSYAHGHHMYSNLNLAPQGRLDEALREIQIARELAPLSLPHNAVLGKIYYLRRDYEEAIEQLLETVDLDPAFAMTYLFLGKAYREKGMFEDAIKAHRRAASLFNSNRALGELGCTLAMTGKESEAHKLLGELITKSETEYFPALSIGLIYVGLGENDLALEWLEKAYEERDLMLAWVKVDPVYEALHGEPQYQELLRRMTLAP